MIFLLLFSNLLLAQEYTFKKDKKEYIYTLYWKGPIGQRILKIGGNNSSIAGEIKKNILSMEQQKFEYQQSFYFKKKVHGDVFLYKNEDKWIPFKLIPLKKIKQKKLKRSYLVTVLDKKIAYVGEKIDIQILLYTQDNVVKERILSYPSLQNFYRRFFLNFPGNETVFWQGVLFKKSIKYMGSIFPKKEGTSIVGKSEISLEVQNGLSSKTVRLETQEQIVKILELPGKNVNLVGKHKFNFSILPKKSKEYLELQLSVSGEGALETLETPKLNLEGLELIESSSKMHINFRRAVRNFHYKYRILRPGEIPEKKYIFRIFNPLKKKYFKVIANLPKINRGSYNILPLLYKRKLPWYYKRDQWFGLSIFLLFLSLIYKIYSKFWWVPLRRCKELKKLIRKQRLNFSAYNKKMRGVLKHIDNSSHFPLKELIEKSDLTNNSKNYFIGLLTMLLEENQKNRTKACFYFDPVSFSDLERTVLTHHENLQEFKKYWTRKNFINDWKL